MARLKLSVSSTMVVVPSDTIDIPDVSTEAFPRSTTELGPPFALVDTSKDFLSLNIKPGDIVQNHTDKTIATITVVNASTILTLSANVAGIGKSYSIYTSTTRDAVFYVGAAGDVEYIDSGGNLNIMKAAPVGWHPVNVKRILDSNTTATDILAGW